MRNLNLRPYLSALLLISVLTAASTANAAPVQFNQVVQVINAKPGKSSAGDFAQIHLNTDVSPAADKDDDDKNKPRPDDRVITEIRTEIVEDDVCDCVEEVVIKRGFPKWPLLGLAAVPLIFLFNNNDNDPPNSTPTPTPLTPSTPTPSVTPTVTPTATPTPPNPPPPPTPEPVPEPMTILLFGTGLAGIGVAARKRFGKNKK